MSTGKAAANLQEQATQKFYRPLQRSTKVWVAAAETYRAGSCIMWVLLVGSNWSIISHELASFTQLCWESTISSSYSYGDVASEREREREEWCVWVGVCKLHWKRMRYKCGDGRRVTPKEGRWREAAALLSTAGTPLKCRTTSTASSIQFATSSHPNLHPHPSTSLPHPPLFHHYTKYCI